MHSDSRKVSTSCVVFEIAECSLEQVCVWSGRFDDPCVDQTD